MKHAAGCLQPAVPPFTMSRLEKAGRRADHGTAYGGLGCQEQHPGDHQKLAFQEADLKKKNKEEEGAELTSAK